jgi:hypothetical protein
MSTKLEVNKIRLPYFVKMYFDLCSAVPRGYSRPTLLNALRFAADEVDKIRVHTVHPDECGVAAAVPDLLQGLLTPPPSP